MKFDRRRALAMVAPGLVLGAWLLLGGLLLRATLMPDQTIQLSHIIAEHSALLVGWWFLAAAMGAWGVSKIYETYVASTGRLVDATRLLVSDNLAPAIVPEGGAQQRRLAEAINDLAGARRTLSANMAFLVEEASHKVALERDQLGALMAELRQSILVCNLDGRILLYNVQARSLFQRLSNTRDRAGGAELIGLGRSIHTVIDKALITHALETLQRGKAVGSSHFVTTTPAGHLLRISLAPVCPEGPGTALSGYVVLVDDITDEINSQSRRDQILIRLTETSRSSLANMQAALDMLDYPDLAPSDRERFQRVVRDEVNVMSERLTALASETSADLLTRWPLQEMLGADLVTAAAQRIEAITGQTATTSEIESALWLNVDSYALTQAIAFLAHRLVDELDQPSLSLRLASAGTWAHLDLVWPTSEGAARSSMGWRTEPMLATEGGSPLSARDVAERHGGEIWLAHDQLRGVSFFRFLLPLALGPISEGPTGERPEYYDFDLFASSDAALALDDQSLESLAYTVFDTETTGLDPAGGDEIIQMGAVRIVNGKLLRGERFDQLIDPERDIPEASIPFHGIRPEMVRGQPRIGEVLRAFHTFAADSVLVGHNVAFDMRFLQLKETASGVRFDHPVLDTLLLANVAQPDETSHALEAIAARLGVPVTGRHSAVGDALTTAQLFVKLIPLLRARDIRTLGQARKAAEASYYSRIKY